MPYIKIINDLNKSLFDNFRNNVVLVYKKQAKEIKDFWYIFKDFSVVNFTTPEKCNLILEFFGQKSYNEYLEFIKQFSYPEYPGLNKVTSKKDINNNPTGLVGIKQKLVWHKDANAFLKYPRYQLIHGYKNTSGSITRIIDGVSAYEKLNSEDKKFVDSLIYEFKNEILKKMISNELNNCNKNYLKMHEEMHEEVQQNGKNIPYSTIANRDLFLNYTDDPYHTIEKPLVKLSVMGVPGLSYENSLLMRFKGYKLKESLEINKWIYDKLINSEFEYAHHWDDGDLLIFDCNCTLHARDAYDNDNRVAHRLLFDLVDYKY